MEKADVGVEKRYLKSFVGNDIFDYAHYVQLVGEEGAEMLMNFIINYMVRMNNDPKEGFHLVIDGRLINKTVLSIFYDLGIIIPFDLGADPAYNPLLYQKLGELYHDCGFHPGKDFCRSIVIGDEKRLEIVKKKAEQAMDEVDTYLKVYCGKTFGVEGLKKRLHNIASSLRKKSERDKFAKRIDQMLLGELLDSMKLDYKCCQVQDNIHQINPNTKNIIEEIDSILCSIPNEVRPNYEDQVELERKIKEAFKNSKLPSRKRGKPRIGKGSYWNSYLTDKGDYDYVLNLEFLEAIKEKQGTARIVTCGERRYLVFRGTWKKSFIGTRWDPEEEHRFSHIHYYFMDVTKESSEKIDGILKKLERCLHGVVAGRFSITEPIKKQLEISEKTALESKYIKFYELLKLKNEWPEDMNFGPFQIGPIPKYGGLIIATLSISCRPNIPLTREDIKYYLKKIEIETLLSWGDYSDVEAIYSFENGSISFKKLYEILNRLCFEGKPLMERLEYLSSKLTELLPPGHMSENTRPLRLKTLLNEKKSLCEGYVLLLGFIFHLWQNIFPELFEADIRFYLLPNEILNNVVRESEFREPHMFVAIKINDGLKIIDPTNRISESMVRRNKGLQELLQEEGFWRSFRIRKIEEESHD